MVSSRSTTRHPSSLQPLPFSLWTLPCLTSFLYALLGPSLRFLEFRTAGLSMMAPLISMNTFGFSLLLLLFHKTVSVICSGLSSSLPCPTRVSTLIRFTRTKCVSSVLRMLWPWVRTLILCAQIWVFLQNSYCVKTMSLGYPLLLTLALFPGAPFFPRALTLFLPLILTDLLSSFGFVCPSFTIEPDSFLPYLFTLS